MASSPNGRASLRRKYGAGQATYGSDLRMNDWKNVTLEMSLKAFGRPGASADEVCGRVFDQWRPLCRRADRVSVLLWVADGSEILEYAGDLDEPVEWGRYVGRANPDPSVLQQMLHGKVDVQFTPRLYCENPATFTYGSLKELIALIRSAGEALLDKPVRVGETFDPGPEFARSPFKYIRHPECCDGASFGSGSPIVSCMSVLKADERRYAAYPDGIPDQTPFGEFFARQVKAFFSDMGFDYLWLSNGFGFGNFPWGYEGSLLKDGVFSLEGLADLQRRNLHFWEALRRECPHIPIEVRGTNISTGVDLASDGTPLQAIYEGRYIDLPAPNSPWAALNKDIGIELAGWMSHVAELPGEDYLFRFYVHDPWWGFSPWLHCYERSPHDIYLPLAVSRIDAQGDTQTPGHLSFLSIDDTFGNLSEQVAREVIPHLLEGVDHRPDAPGPFVWIYPFAEYHQWVQRGEPRIKGVFCGDVLIRDAINRGFPLNTVCSTGNYVRNAGRLRERILVSPVPEPDSAWEGALLEHANRRGGLFLYGALSGSSRRLRDILGIQIADGIEGDFTLRVPDGALRPPPDFADGLGFIHRDAYGGGPLCETGGDNALLFAESEQGRRTLAAEAPVGAGTLVWYRGSVEHPNPPAPWLDDGYINLNDAPGRFSPARFAAALLQRFGWELGYHCPEREILEPALTIHVTHNGLVFAGAAQNSLVGYEFATPAGAPVLLNTDCTIADGRASYRFPRAWRGECRVLVQQKAASVVSCRELHPGKNRRLVVTGLKDAEVLVLPESGCEGELQVSGPGGKDVRDVEEGRFCGLTCFKTRQAVTGSIVARW